ncbi:MAG: type II toxin-antitoxin system VapC family toxin [Planctomycetes bacterium]|nr:type II toxin-antitoxin system VapC family toxin [Planctomycetota bacterium]
MTVLLDTHMWVWWLLGSDRLPKNERAALDRLASRGALRLAAVSLWEAQMLHAKSRLTLNRPFDTWIRDAAAAGVVQIVPLDVEVVIALNGLPASFHGDPADRLIVATSRAHRIPLATHDREIRRSRTTTLWKAG